MSTSEELLPISEAARRLHLSADDLRRRLTAAEWVLVNGRRLSLRQRDLVAVRPPWVRP